MPPGAVVRVDDVSPVRAVVTNWRRGRQLSHSGDGHFSDGPRDARVATRRFGQPRRFDGEPAPARRHAGAPPLPVGAWTCDAQVAPEPDGKHGTLGRLGLFKQQPELVAAPSRRFQRSRCSDTGGHAGRAGPARVGGKVGNAFPAMAYHCRCPKLITVDRRMDRTAPPTPTSDGGCALSRMRLLPAQLGLQVQRHVRFTCGAMRGWAASAASTASRSPSYGVVSRHAVVPTAYLGVVAAATVMRTQPTGAYLPVAAVGHLLAIRPPSAY